MNLISDELKLAAKEAMQNVFDTFARDSLLRFFKPDKQTLVVSDPNFIADFEEGAYFQNYTKTADYSDFKVRIWYLDRQEQNTFVTGGQDLNIKMAQSWNRIRIQMQQDAYDYSKDAVLFVINNERYKIEEPFARIGILGEFQFYELILHRIT
jgi:hypothetical protein